MGDNASEGQVREIIKKYYDRIINIESLKYDMEKEVEIKEYQINELNIAVNDLRGKFIKPTLKRVSKYENKFAKLQKKAAEFNFRNQLKTVKKKEFTMDEEEAGDKKGKKKPDWALGAKEGETKPLEGEGAAIEAATHSALITKQSPSQRPHPPASCGICLNFYCFMRKYSVLCHILRKYSVLCHILRKYSAKTC